MKNDKNNIIAVSFRQQYFSKKGIKSNISMHDRSSIL